MSSSKKDLLSNLSILDYYPILRAAQILDYEPIDLIILAESGKLMLCVKLTGYELCLNFNFLDHFTMSRSTQINKIRNWVDEARKGSRFVDYFNIPGTNLSSINPFIENVNLEFVGEQRISLRSKTSGLWEIDSALGSGFYTDLISLGNIGIHRWDVIFKPINNSEFDATIPDSVGDDVLFTIGINDFYITRQQLESISNMNKNENVSEEDISTDEEVLIQQKRIKKIDGQCDYIISLIIKKGIDPKSFPYKNNGKKDIKDEIRQVALKEKNLFTESSFNKAWQAIRREGRLILIASE